MTIAFRARRQGADEGWLESSAMADNGDLLFRFSNGTTILKVTDRAAPIMVLCSGDKNAHEMGHKRRWRRQ